MGGWWEGSGRVVGGLDCNLSHWILLTYLRCFVIGKQGNCKHSTHLFEVIDLQWLILTKASPQITAHTCVPRIAHFTSPPPTHTLLTSHPPHTHIAHFTSPPTPHCSLHIPPPHTHTHTHCSLHIPPPPPTHTHCSLHIPPTHTHCSLHIPPHTHTHLVSIGFS